MPFIGTPFAPIRAIRVKFFRSWCFSLRSAEPAEALRVKKLFSPISVHPRPSAVNPPPPQPLCLRASVVKNPLQRTTALPLKTENLPTENSPPLGLLRLAALGLLPVALATGVGTDTQRPVPVNSVCVNKA